MTPSHPLSTIFITIALDWTVGPTSLHRPSVDKLSTLGLGNNNNNKPSTKLGGAVPDATTRNAGKARKCLSRSKVKIKRHRNLVTCGATVTNIPTMLHQFLVCIVFARTDRQRD